MVSSKLKLKRGQNEGSEVSSQGSYSPPKRGRNLGTLDNDEAQLALAFTVKDKESANIREADGARRNWDQSTITAPDSSSTIMAQGFPRRAPNPNGTGPSPPVAQPRVAESAQVVGPVASTSASASVARPEQMLLNAVFDQIDDERPPRTGRLGVKTSDDEDDEDTYPAITHRNDYRNLKLPDGFRLSTPGNASSGGRDTASQVSNSSTASARNQMGTMALGIEPQAPPSNSANQQSEAHQKSSPFLQTGVAPKLFATPVTRLPQATPQNPQP